jgi:acyl-CoA reductase-like NAD-dependent aldehyde dehydrogenase
MSTAPMLKTEAKRFHNFIGGEWVAPTTGTYAPNLSPAALEDVVGEYPTSGAKDAAGAVAAAKDAFPAWSGMPGPSRGRARRSSRRRAR